MSHLTNIFEYIEKGKGLNNSIMILVRFGNLYGITNSKIADSFKD